MEDESVLVTLSVTAFTALSIREKAGCSASSLGNLDMLESRVLRTWASAEAGDCSTEVLQVSEGELCSAILSAGAETAARAAQLQILHATSCENRIPLSTQRRAQKGPCGTLNYFLPCNAPSTAL
mmetsp:Transcript_120704/g.209563  ORF Transcript_120704/g.209563 Transcript_120704/m.209563 type:complete len:125 (-) Transcript_120704:44-418(-)